MKIETTSKIRNTIILIFSFALPIILIVVFGHEIKNINNLIRATGILGPLIVILLMGLLSVTPISNDPIVILNGAIFGPIYGVLISWIGNVFASIIEYFIGRSLRQITDFEKTKRSLPFGLGRFPADSVWFLLFGRLIPQFGGTIVSLTAGFNRVPIKRYLWTSALSCLFGSIILAVGGSSLLNTLFK